MGSVQLKILILMQRVHSYSVGEDFVINSQEHKIMCNVIKRMVEEYKIDGFRWDLKGFTQNCPNADQT
jgi:pullulanase/glycogen debranching enzyme